MNLRLSGYEFENSPIVVDKVSKKVFPGLGKNGLGVKLHTFNRKFLVPYPHDFTFLGPSGNLELGRKGFLFNEKRMVPRGFKRIRKILKNGFSVMDNRGGFSV